MNGKVEITAEKILANTSVYVEVWHLGFPKNPDRAFIVQVREFYSDIAYSENLTWNEVIKLCKKLNEMGINKSKFFVKGSKVYRDFDIRKDLKELKV